MSDNQRALTFSKFNSAKGILRADPKTRIWDKWVKLLTTHRTTDQKDTVNYDKIKGRIISIPCLSYKSGKYIINI